MNHPVTLDVPDDLARRAEMLATQAHSRVEDMLPAWLTCGAIEAPIEMLPDEQILVFHALPALIRSTTLLHW